MKWAHTAQVEYELQETELSPHKSTFRTNLLPPNSWLNKWADRGRFKRAASGNHCS